MHALHIHSSIWISAQCTCIVYVYVNFVIVCMRSVDVVCVIVVYVYSISHLAGIVHCIVNFHNGHVLYIVCIVYVQNEVVHLIIVCVYSIVCCTTNASCRQK